MNIFKKENTPAIPDDAFLFDADGVIQPVSAAWWQDQGREVRMMFGHHHALYGFPTEETIFLLGELVDAAATLEIGAGNGGFCKALGIRGTDSYQQDNPAIKAIYSMHRQPTVKYGSHVEQCSALEAIIKYRPKAVLGCWVTHRYAPERHECGGNVDGIDEHELLSLVDDYYFIGNTKVHASKPIFQDLKHGRITTHTVKGLYGRGTLASRASGGDDFLIHLTRK